MSYYVGLDVSVKLTAVCVLDEEGGVVRERVVASDPDDIGECIEEVGSAIGRIGMEAGPLAPWLFGGFAERGLPVVCIEALPMTALAKASSVNTPRRATIFIAQAMRAGIFKVAYAKTDET